MPRKRRRSGQRPVLGTRCHRGMGPRKVCRDRSQADRSRHQVRQGRADVDQGVPDRSGPRERPRHRCRGESQGRYRQHLRVELPRHRNAQLAKKRQPGRSRPGVQEIARSLTERTIANYFVTRIVAEPARDFAMNVPPVFTRVFALARSSCIPEARTVPR